MRDKYLITIILLTLFSVNNIKSDDISISNFHKVDRGIYRGARPKQQGIKELKQMGIKTIVNLEREVLEKVPGEVKKERQWAEEAGIKFFHIPMHPFFAPKKEEIMEALAHIANLENQPVYVHCDRGSDRTGIVIAAYRIRVNGWTVDKAFDEMKRYGHRAKLLFWWKEVLFYIKKEKIAD